MKTRPAEPTDARVLEILDEYLAGLRAGRPPDREALLARHPDLAASLAASFRALDFVHVARRTLEDPEARLGLEEPASAGRVLGDYRLLREIGRGGMAVVYEAEQISLGRHVALKVLPFAAVLEPKQLQRFKNEAQAAAHLKHPHIVPVHAVGCEHGVHFYAMQYVEGQSLAVAIREMREMREARGGGGRGSPEDPTVGGTAAGSRTPISSHGSTREPAYVRMAAQLGVQAAEALDYAHQVGIVHRDVKPGNLLVDLAGTLWITDFGLAHTMKDAGLTITGELLGTIRYMSPEQALAKRVPVDHRTDVYSLGATLYELLTLEPAFPGDDVHLVLQDIASKEPVPPRQLNPALPRDLETVLLKAMAKDPAGRYATAQEMADDLGRFLAHRPIEAQRPGVLRRAAKWSRRHRGLVGTAVGVVGLAVAGLAIGTALLWREKEQTRAAFVRAEANLGLALQALDQVYLDEAAGHPRIREGLPHDLLERGLGFYEGFARANAQNQAVAFLTGRAQHSASRIFRKLGRDDRAREALGRAILIFRGAIQRWPHDARTHHNLGYALYDQGDYPGAIEEYREALRLKPDDSRVHVNLGLAYFDMGDPDGAIREYREAIRLNPDNAVAHSNLGNTLFKKGDPRGALSESREAIRLDPELASAHLNLGNALSVAGDLDGAIRAYREGIRREPALADAHFSLGNALDATGDVEGAIPEFREAIRLNPKDFGAHVNLGAALVAMGDPESAIAVFRAAVELQPDDGRGHLNLGNALLLRGRFGEALTSLRRGHELGSKRPDWAFPSRAWIQQAESMVALEGRVEDVLSGKTRPRDAAERAAFAEVLYLKSRYADAARMSVEAFAEDAALAEDLSRGFRYAAACAAVQAAARGEAGAAEWRNRALAWLRADLAAREESPSDLVAALEHWKRDPDLASVRDRVGDLPEAERAAWQGLWAAVEAARARARQGPR